MQKLAPEWRRLSQCDPHASVFQHWEWAQAFWKAYGGDVSLYTPVVYQKEAVVSILPLVRRGAQLAFVGSPHSDYNDILCEEQISAAAIEASLHALLRSRTDWESCTLDNVPEQSRLVRHALALPYALRKHLQLVFRYPSPTIVVADNDTRVLDAVINKDQLKRYHRKLQKLGKVTFRHLETQSEARAHLAQFFDQHVTRRAMAGFPSQFLEPDQRRFYEALVDELDLRTQLRFGVLELDSTPIAYHIGVQSNGRFIFYKPAFDVNYWDSCPGDALLRSLLQYARDSGLREFDFSIGDESYKNRYANAVRQNYALYFDRYPARLATRLQIVLRYARHSVRRRPRLKRVLNDADRWLRANVRWRRCINSGRLVFRKLVWARDEVLLLAGVASSVETESPATAIRPIGLDALARMSVKFPDFFNAARLHEYRGRLKQGEKAFAAEGAEGMPWIFWVGRRSEVFIPEGGWQCGFPLSAPALVLYDTCSPQAVPAGRVPPGALRALIAHCDGEVWTYCLKRQTAFRSLLEQAGFHPKYRVVRRALFHWFRSTRLLSCAEMTDSLGDDGQGRSEICQSRNAPR
jgi:CelD/BcsL family acetyltransferase involved in cellulose biosynthesis